MMEGDGKPPPTTYLLPNLTQTHALPLLPLPEIPPDSEAQCPTGAFEQLDVFSRDEELVSQLQGLLQTADTTSMYAPGLPSHNAKSRRHRLHLHGTLMCSKLRCQPSDSQSRVRCDLEQALLRRDPNIFSYGLYSKLADACAAAREGCMRCHRIITVIVKACACRRNLLAIDRFRRCSRGEEPTTCGFATGACSAPSSTAYCNSTRITVCSRKGG